MSEDGATADVTVRELAAGLAFPEGPIAMADGSVLLVEIASANLTRVASDGTVERLVAFGEPSWAGPNGAAIGPDGAVYVCNNGGFIWSELRGMKLPFELGSGVNQSQQYRTGSIDRIDLATNERTVLYDSCDGVGLRGPNDIVFDSTGGFWFTDLGKGRLHDIDRGAVYYARPDGSAIERKIFPLLGPNGIGLSPDESTLYVADTPTGRLWAYEIVAPGALDREPRPAGVCLANTLGHFDSLAVEADGTVVIAALGEGLCVVRPDGDVGFVAMPDRMTTNVCFGGPDRRTAYVTLSASGRLAAIGWPRPGHEPAFST